MLKKICVMIFVALTGSLFFTNGTQGRAGQDAANLAGNQCVACHSNIAAPLALSSRYFDWHISLHRENGVGCDRCHGGDPKERDASKAHAGVLPSSNRESRLHPNNLASTCQTCHAPVVAAFTESAHYKTLQAAGLGPSCNTCHQHMATAVILAPEQTATMCAHCHNSVNGMMARRPEIPERAQAVMESIRRANAMVAWTNSLLDEGRKRNLDVSAESEQMRAISATLSQAKIEWHTFALDTTRQKADEAFTAGERIKNDLMKKLGYMQ